MNTALDGKCARWVSAWCVCICMHFFHQATRINFPAAAGGDEGEGGMREEKPFAFFICEKAHAGEREKEEEPLFLSRVVLCSSLRVCVPLWKYRKSFSTQPKSHFIFFPSLCAILERSKRKEREREACDGVQYFNTHARIHQRREKFMR